jgi:hypothetical protein
VTGADELGEPVALAADVLGEQDAGKREAAGVVISRVLPRVCMGAAVGESRRRMKVRGGAVGRKTMAWDGVPDGCDRRPGGGGSDRMLAVILALWVFAVLPLSYLAAAELRGFDDSMCRAHHACSWRYVSPSHSRWW